MMESYSVLPVCTDAGVGDKMSMFDEEGENAGPFVVEVACEKFSVHLDVEKIWITIAVVSKYMIGHSLGHVVIALHHWFLNAFG